jgi:hypothetical protein
VWATGAHPFYALDFDGTRYCLLHAARVIVRRGRRVRLRLVAL